MLCASLIAKASRVATLAWGCLLLVADARTPKSVRRTDDPALQAPIVDFSPGKRYDDHTRVFQGVPTIERTANGRLWAAWFARGPDEAEEHVLVVTSDDGGKSWSPPRLVIDPVGDARAFDPCLWLDPDGLLWLFWAQSNGRWDGRGGVWCITSEDSQTRSPTWSEPRRLCNGVMLNKPTALSTGERLFPVSLWAKSAGLVPALDLLRRPGDESGANVLVMRDADQSLVMLGQVRLPQREIDEHHIIERSDGSLWMLLRAPYGIAESESRDGGRTWSKGKQAPIRHVNSRFCIRRLRSGNLMLVTHEPPDGKTRSNLIARLSTDDGRTWQGGLMLDERPGVSYPDATEEPGGVISVIYDYERSKARQILMARFNELNLLRGKPSRTTRLKIQVNEAVGSARSNINGTP